MRTLPLSEIRKQVAVLEVAERVFDAAVLFALHRTGVFMALADGGRSCEELASATAARAEPLRAVLDAAVALGLLTKGPMETYEAAPHFIDVLDRTSGTYLGEWVEFLHSLATPLLRLQDVVGDEVPQTSLLAAAGAGEEPAREMTRAMDAYARSRGLELATRLDLADARRFLDLGCGPGTYAMAVAERYPHLEVTLLDLPGPIAEARRIATERQFDDRLRFVSGDAISYRDSSGYDAILVSNVLHMLGPERSRALVRNCFSLLCPNGRLIVQAQFLDEGRTSPRWPALLNLVQTVATPAGRNHTVGETVRWLQDSGFTDVEHVTLSLWNVCSCIMARRPATAARPDLTAQP